LTDFVFFKTIVDNNIIANICYYSHWSWEDISRIE